MAGKTYAERFMDNLAAHADRSDVDVADLAKALKLPDKLKGLSDRDLTRLTREVPGVCAKLAAKAAAKA